MALTTRIDWVNSLKNKIINGNMDFYQRAGIGGSIPHATLNTNGGRSLDRWNVIFAATSQASVSQDTDVPTLAQSGFQSSYSLKLTVTTPDASPAPGDYHAIRYTIEGYDYQELHGRPIRLSFWVKSALAGTYSICFRNSGGTRSYTTTCTISAANTWEKKYIDLTADNAGTWLFDNQGGLLVQWMLMAGSSNQTSTLNQWQNASTLAASTQANLFATNGNTFLLSQVSLIPGDFASYGSSVDIPFARAGRTIGDELRMCQRYHCKSFNVGQSEITNSGTLAGAIGYRVFVAGATACRFTVQFPCFMRSAPTITFYNPSAANSNWLNNSLGLDSGASSASDMGEKGFLAGNAQVSGDLVTNAIYVHYSAEAEF